MAGTPLETAVSIATNHPPQRHALRCVKIGGKARAEGGIEKQGSAAFIPAALLAPLAFEATLTGFGRPSG
jgi:hypothetical protein